MAGQYERVKAYVYHCQFAYNIRPMKRVVIIIVIFIFVDLIAGYFLTKNIDWSTVDGIGVPVTPESTDATSSAKSSDSTLYVKCEMDGTAYVMTAEACGKARYQHGGMSP